MRKSSVKEVLDKLKWDPRFDFSQVTIAYSDRFHGVLEVSAREIESVGNKFLYLKHGRVIPQHRIVEIRHRGEVVWRKR